MVLQRLKRLPARRPALAQRRSPSSARAPGRTPAAQLAGLDDDHRRDGARRALPRRHHHPRRADRVGFVHPIVLSAIYNDLPVHVRADSARPRRPPAGRARRRAGGGRRAPARHGAARRCVGGRGPPGGRQRALVLGDPATAVDCLQRALEEPPPEPSRAAVLNELASAEAQSGRPAAVGALPRGDGASGRPRGARPDRRRPRPRLKFRGDSPRALDVLRRALAELDPRSARRGARARTGRPRRTSAWPRGRCWRRRSPPSEAPAAATTGLDRLHLMASAFETVIAGRPVRALRRAGPQARSRRRPAHRRERRRPRRSSPRPSR